MAAMSLPYSEVPRPLAFNGRVFRFVAGDWSARRALGYSVKGAGSAALAALEEALDARVDQ